MLVESKHQIANCQKTVYEIDKGFNDISNTIKIETIDEKIPGAHSAYKLILEIYKDVPSRMKSTEAIFTEIYKENYWRGKNSVSGQGSDLEQTETIVKELPILFKDLKISTMLDIPCGDFFWMKMVDLKGIQYIGADVVEE